MNVTKERYEEAAKVIRGLSPWMVEGEIWPAAKVVNAVNDQNPELAKLLWYHLLASHLDFEQMVKVGGKMLALATHHVYCGVDQAAEEGFSDTRFRQIQSVLTQLEDACRYLEDWRIDRAGRFSSIYRELDQVQVDCYHFFFLPWNMPEWEKGDFWSLLLSACNYLGTLGVGAVDHEESWVIISWEGDSTRLNFKFGPTRNGDPDYLTSCWDTASPLTIIVEDLSGAFSSTFSLDGVMHDEFKQRLGITPKMSRQQIQAEFDKYCYRLPKGEVP
ncbi:MAG: hypothetical protein ABH810_00445 [bacterium]